MNWPGKPITVIDPALANVVRDDMVEAARQIRSPSKLRPMADVPSAAHRGFASLSWASRDPTHDPTHEPRTGWAA